MTIDEREYDLNRELENFNSQWSELGLWNECCERDSKAQYSDMRKAEHIAS